MPVIVDRSWIERGGASGPAAHLQHRRPLDL
jgi:hypothetical protein